MFRAISRLAIILTIVFTLTFNYANPALALGGKQPDLDQPAPEFTLQTNNDSEAKNVSLTDYQGQWVVLYFYPQDFTPGCTLEARKFQQDLQLFHDINTEIIGVSADDVQSHQEFCDAEGLKFPLLADTKGQVSKAYGSWLTGHSLRHTYIIDPDGILRAKFLGVRPIIHSAEVLETLQDLQKV